MTKALAMIQAIPLHPAPAGSLPESRLLRLPLFREVGEKEVVQSVEAAGEAGFNGLVTPLTLGGLPVFPSPTPKRNRLQPFIPEFRKRDPLGEVAEAAGRAGLLVYGLVRPWRPGGDAAQAVVQRWFRSQPTWFAVGRHAPRRRRPGESGGPAYCPSSPECRRYLGDLMAEALEGYPIEGLILDTMEPPWGLAPGSDGCCCHTCREAARETGLHSEQESAGPEATAAWADWRVRLARQNLIYWRQRAHKSREAVNLRCIARAVLPEGIDGGGETPAREDGAVARLWQDWLAHGLIDGLHLEDLPADPEAFAEAFDMNLARWPDDSLLYPVVKSGEPERLAQTVEFLRRRPVTGFVVEWEGAMSVVDSGELASGCFSEPAHVPELNPSDALRRLCQEVAFLAPPGSGVGDFLSDLVQFMERPTSSSALEALEATVENIRGLEARILQGQVVFGENAPQALRRLSQAKRIARLQSRWTAI